jgi:hypothetical protein
MTGHAHNYLHIIVYTHSGAVNSPAHNLIAITPAVAIIIFIFMLQVSGNIKIITLGASPPKWRITTHICNNQCPHLSRARTRAYYYAHRAINYRNFNPGRSVLQQERKRIRRSVHIMHVDICVSQLIACRAIRRFLHNAAPLMQL